MSKFLLLLIILFLVLACKKTDSPEKHLTTPETEKFEIYNMHEHIQNFEQNEKTQKAMTQAGISHLLLVGSSEATLLLSRKGFFGYDENNDEIIKLYKHNSNFYMPFCTIKPEDTEKLNKLKECMEKGSKGLKLYSGHTLFYTLPLNATIMDEIYSYTEEERIPIVFHINPGNDKIKLEMEEVLQKYPELIVNCPHFCLSSINETRLRYLMDKYPKLYTDISFGFYAQDGFNRVSGDPQKFKKTLQDYSDRIMFGTDMVITSSPQKTEEWIYNLTMCYRNMLEKEKYVCKVVGNIDAEYNGLNLDKQTLKKIYETNAKRFLAAEIQN